MPAITRRRGWLGWARLVGPPEPGAPAPPLAGRLAWFVGLAVGGSLTTALVAYALRSLLLLH